MSKWYIATAMASIGAIAYAFFGACGLRVAKPQVSSHTYVLYSATEEPGCCSCEQFFPALRAMIPAARITEKQSDTVSAFVERARYQIPVPAVLVFAKDGRLDGAITACMNEADFVRQLRAYEAGTSGLLAIRERLIENPMDVDALLRLYDLQSVSIYFGDVAQTRKKIEIIEREGEGVAKRIFAVVDLFERFDASILEGNPPSAATLMETISAIEEIADRSRRIPFLVTLATAAQNLEDQEMEKRVLASLWDCSSPEWKEALTAFIEERPVLTLMPALSDSIKAAAR